MLGRNPHHGARGPQQSTEQPRGREAAADSGPGASAAGRAPACLLPHSAGNSCFAQGQSNFHLNSVLFAGTTRSGDRKLSSELETSYFTSGVGEEQTQPISGQLPGTYLLLPRSSCFHSIPSLAASESFKTPKPLAEAGDEGVAKRLHAPDTRESWRWLQEPFHFHIGAMERPQQEEHHPWQHPKGHGAHSPAARGAEWHRDCHHPVAPAPTCLSSHLRQRPPRAQKPQQLAAELRSSPQNAAASFKGHREPASCKSNPLGSAPGALPLQGALFLQQS